MKKCQGCGEEKDNVHNGWSVEGPHRSRIYVMFRGQPVDLCYECGTEAQGALKEQAAWKDRFMDIAEQEARLVKKRAEIDLAKAELGPRPADWKPRCI